MPRTVKCYISFSNRTKTPYARIIFSMHATCLVYHTFGHPNNTFNKVVVERKNQKIFSENLLSLFKNIFAHFVKEVVKRFITRLYLFLIRIYF
jgi:hypothetical protein